MGICHEPSPAGAPSIGLASHAKKQPLLRQTCPSPLLALEVCLCASISTCTRATSFLIMNPNSRDLSGKQEHVVRQCSGMGGKPWESSVRTQQKSRPKSHVGLEVLEKGCNCDTPGGYASPQTCASLPHHCVNRARGVLHWVASSMTNQAAPSLHLTSLAGLGQGT